MHGIWSLCFGLAVLWSRTLAAPPAQVPLRDGERKGSSVGGLEEVEKKRPLHGRFLHITDLHPDRFYKVNAATTTDAMCHRGKGHAGIYGAEMSDCDTPHALVNETFRWIEEHLKDDIDFIVWTGDSARHDNDEAIPRNADQVISSNQFLVDKMFEVFGKHNGDEEDDDPNNDFIIPVVPNFGNNDILPHNVMTKGPNRWTRTYSKVWKQFVPEAQKHQFEQGGWFYVEVIPNELAVFSLNTLYFFEKNAATDGCASPREPGYQQMEWLRIQLQFMRERGVKAILSGHVPPIRSDAKTLWEETCWQKYTLWMRQYRDVIVGSLYGHFNYDHFLLQDFKQLHKSTKHGRMGYYQTAEDGNDEVGVAVSSDYWTDMRDHWAKLPEPPKSLRGIDGAEDEEDLEPEDEEQSDVEVELSSKKHKKAKKARQKYLKKIGGEYAERYAASFVSASVVPNLFPVIRVFEYNITGLEDMKGLADSDPKPLYIPYYSSEVEEDDDEDVEASKKKKKHKKKKSKKYKFTVPDPPADDAPPGPAYSPQPLSLVRYTQYFANLTHINNDVSSNGGGVWSEEDKREARKKSHPHPKKFEYQVHYDTRDDDVYQLPDLTMPSLVDLARRIGEFVSEDDVEDGNQEGGVDGERDDDEDDEGEEGEVDADKHKKKKHKKKKKKHHHHHTGKYQKQNEPWYTFIRRAFVETMDREEVEDEFG